ncbi:hypothetical protein [Fictibacillus sp. NRS-1165]|uniref:hypothetical protein n=1 Tax=Fictibacillus sp. NRS-1165 TaxID=3144463 RepID=UPI003D237374
MLSLIYVVARVTQKALYLDRFSVNAENPVRFHWNTIGINTGFIKEDPGSVYYIWITPVYIAVLLALLLTIMAVVKRK